MDASHVEKMQLARRDKLGDMTTREAGEARMLKLLMWIYRWGWTSPSVANRHADPHRNGLIERAVKAGLIEKIKTDGGGARDVPTAVLLLTKAGAAEVERHFDDPDQLLPLTKKAPFELLRHNSICQRKALDFMSAGDEIETEKELMRYLGDDENPSRAGQKVPDFIVVGEQLDQAVEVELTGKWGRDFDQMAERIFRALSENAYQQCLFLSDSPAILKRYQKALQPGGAVNKWVKSSGRWIGMGRIAITHDFTNQLFFELLT